MKDFLIVMALVVMAGCATTEEKSAVEAAKPDGKAAAAETALPKAETFDAAYQRHLAAVRNWGCHTFPDDAVKGVPGAMAFLAENADKEASHRAQFQQMKVRILETLTRGRDFTTGIPYAKAMYADAKAGGDRCAAARYLAMGIIERTKDYAAADKLYVDLLEPARTVPGAHWTIVEMVRARTYLHTMRLDQKGAIGYVDAERAKVTGNDSWKKTMNGYFDDIAAGVFEAFFDYRGAVDYFTKRGNRAKVFWFYERGKVSDIPAMTKLSHELVLDEAVDAGLRTRAWLWLYSRDEKFCEANANRCFDGNRGSTNAFASAVARTLFVSNLGDTYGALTPAYDRNPTIAAKLWEHYLKAVKLTKAPVDFRAAQYAALAYAELGDKAKAVAAANEGLSNDKLKPEERFELALMARTLGFKGNEAEIAAQAKAAVAELGKGVDAKLLKKFMQRAFAAATVGRDETLKRGVAKYYLDEVRATLPKKSYTVHFSDRNVAGAGDWANLPFKPDESDFDRVYGGGGMAFMTTDVATGDRGNAVQGGEKARKHPTTLQVVADEWGIHVVCTFYDRRARQFESGELDCGSYESYIAPGENTPYACFLSYPKKDARGSVMNTSYDQPGHRRINVNDPTKYRSDTVFTDDAVVTYTAFSWDCFADHIPADGAEWDFESIFWGPVPSAWNGTESIHGRSTWGKLRFELGDAGRVKIQRAQLFKAVNAYKAEKLPKQVSRGSVQEGVFSHWSDDELGDLDFYEARLKPLMAELDPVAEKVKVGMSDADVRAIAGAYLSRFRDIRFEVARLRARYLAESACKTK